jgi:hypothetical protein
MLHAFWSIAGFHFPKMGTFLESHSNAACVYSGVMASPRLLVPRRPTRSVLQATRECLKCKEVGAGCPRGSRVEPQMTTQALQESPPSRRSDYKEGNLHGCVRQPFSGWVITRICENTKNSSGPCNRLDGGLSSRTSPVELIGIRTKFILHSNLERKEMGHLNRKASLNPFCSCAATKRSPSEPSHMPTDSAVHRRKKRQGVHRFRYLQPLLMVCTARAISFAKIHHNLTKTAVWCMGFLC